MFNCTSALLFMIIISSCSGKAVSNSNSTTLAPPQLASTVKTSAEDKQTLAKSVSNWPKVDAYDCSGNGEVRSLHIELTAPKGCKLWYSSFSETEPIAQSKNGLSYCEKVNKNIRHNLESAGYICAPKDANKTIK